MADFCQQCSIELFGEDCGDLANLGPAEKLGPREGWLVLCEGCGPIVVTPEGACMSCDKHGPERQPTS